jgi:hypothetical protein
MIDRLRMIEQPLGVSMDQQLLRELRTTQPETENGSAAVEAIV